MKRKNNHGFTIVELLIVIVVIGILAAITIISYSGVQKRAYNTAMIAAVNAWIQGLTLQGVENAGPIQLPSSGSYASGICLGSQEDYPATSHLGAGECFSGATTSSQVYAAVKQSVGNIRFTAREFEDPDSDGDGQWLRGMVYDRTYDSSAGYRYYIFYNLYGENGTDFDCGVAGATVNDYSTSLKVTTCQVDMSRVAGVSPIVW